MKMLSMEIIKEKYDIGQPSAHRAHIEMKYAPISSVVFRYSVKKYCIAPQQPLFLIKD